MLEEIVGHGDASMRPSGDDDSLLWRRCRFLRYLGYEWIRFSEGCFEDCSEKATRAPCFTIASTSTQIYKGTSSWQIKAEIRHSNTKIQESYRRA